MHTKQNERLKRKIQIIHVNKKRVSLSSNIQIFQEEWLYLQLFSNCFSFTVHVLHIFNTAYFLRYHKEQNGYLVVL